ncbi:prolyl oligopeptidase family serine peptidase [Nevskia soli]|uniref:prolyl oligopeptidase family serine peptidase n=1 Tax=Nevskia soli TaxID=418856 RepID=UPI000559C8DF|nr:prolyl oligopeptidase family serine peptidase [Nevskia soli]
MKRFVVALSFLAAAGVASAATPVALSYPPAARGEVVDEYHGIKVPDPYRWMEDIDSPQTRNWVEAEAKQSSDYLAAIPGRDGIVERMRKIWNFERWSAPEKHGKWWIYSHNDGLQSQSVLFATDNPKLKGKILLDPNSLSKDGTVSLRESAVSDDGRYFAYALSEAGSDWQVWRVRDIASGQDLPDELHWSKAGGGSWRKDGSGFYYTVYDAPREGELLKAANQYEKLYFHKLGTPQSADTLVYTRSDDPDWFVGGQVTDDGRYLVISANYGDQVQNTVLVQDLSVADGKISEVIPKPAAQYSVIGNIGSTLYVLTDDNAPRYRIVAIDLADAAPEKWRTVVAESKDTLDQASLVGGQIVAQYLQDAHSAVRRYSPQGKLLGEVKLPGLGTASGFAGRIDDTDTYYSYSSYTTPASVYRLDLRSGKSALLHAPKLAGFKPADFESRQMFYASKDGTRVPMIVTARKGVKQDGANPTILYGYGGFNISVQPTFSAAIATWIQMGGVYAVANMRGGGEYGRAWHEAGMKTHKQNVFDDFIGGAEYLIAQKWTSPKRLAVYGRSNGGLLIGAVTEQRPDLFAAVIPQVGVMDMLRFRDFTVGKGWESDYGSVENADEFKALLAYSPYHNIKAGVKYPPMLILTGDHDDRVYPAHSFKFAAAMQHADPDGNPILIRIDLRTGHGSGKPTGKLIEEYADIYAFALNAMGLAK